MRNLAIARVLALANGARFGLGIWVLYFLRYTSYAGIGVLEAVIIVTAFVAEVPSGALADRIGRKRTLALSFLLLALAFGLMASADGFAVLCLGCAVFATGAAFFSGTFEALIYDSLAQLGQTERYIRLISEMRALRLGALAVTAVSGGLLFRLQPRYPYVASALVFFCGFGAACLLIEPRREASGAAPATRMAALVRTALAGLRQALRTDPSLFFLWLAGMPLVFSEEILDDVLAVAFGFEPAQLGLLFAVIYLAAAGASRLTPRLLLLLPQGRLVALLAILSGLSLVISPWLGMQLGGLTLILRYKVHAVWSNLASEACNRHAGAAQRATTLSLYAMARSLPYVLLAYPLGAAIDRWGARWVALAVGLLLLAVCSLQSRAFSTKK